MRGLDAMIRVRGWELDALRREISDLDAVASARRNEAAKFEIEIVREQEFARRDEVGAYAYAKGYADAVIAHRESLARAILAADAAVDERRAVLAEAFTELKRLEIARDARLERERLERERREAIALDELSIDLHRRRPT